MLKKEDWTRSLTHRRIEREREREREKRNGNDAQSIVTLLTEI